jgi:hypothetical protein
MPVFPHVANLFYINFVLMKNVFVGVTCWGVIELCLRRFYQMRKWYAGTPLEDIDIEG